MESFRSYKLKNGGCCLLCDLTKMESLRQERIVHQNDSFICIVPFWAVWPFETMIIPKLHLSSLCELDSKQVIDLADILQAITSKYDNLFECSFPYSMGIHGSPIRSTSDTDDIMHLHLHFYPPLLRSSTVRKFLVGFEMLGEPQRDLTAEQAASRLRALPRIHYTQKQSL